MKKSPKKKASQSKNSDSFRKQSITELASDTWNDGPFESKVSVGKSSGGSEGIKIRTAKRTWRFNEHQYGIWLPKGLNLAEWIKWVILSIKKFSRRFWKLDVDVKVLEEEVDIYKQRAKDLELELEQTKSKLRDSEKRLRIEREDKRRAEQLVSRIEEYEKTLKEFITLLDDASLSKEQREAQVKIQIVKNKWFLGLECEVGAKEQPIDTQSAIDLHILTDFNQDKIFEFKSPNLEPFYQKGIKTRLYMKTELGEAIHQLIIYLTKTNLYSFLKEEGTYGVRGPSGFVVMGYKLTPAQKNAITDWNFHLRPHVLLLTYHDLVENAKRILTNIRSARNLTP